MNNQKTFFGFGRMSEVWNGRLAMTGFIIALAVELFTGNGILHFWGIL